MKYNSTDFYSNTDETTTTKKTVDKVKSKAKSNRNRAQY